MSDIEKLQKLKDYILADQHPFFTSAPKVAHLLSLHVSGSDYDRSTPSNEHERPLSSIPLADRLSSPKPPVNASFNDFESTETASQNHVSQEEEQPLPRKSEEPEESSTSAEGRDRGDVEMSEPHSGEPTRSGSPPSRGEGNFPPQHPQNYSRPNDMQRRPEKHSFGDNVRRSPRQGGRDLNTWEDRRPPAHDSQPRYPSGNNNANYNHNRPGEQGNRYGQGPPRSGYNQHPNRRFSGSERPQFEQRYYENDRDRRNDYPPNSQDDRRPEDRFMPRQPLNGPRGYQNNNNRPYHDRRSESQSMGGAHQGTQQPMSRNNSEVIKPDEEMKTSPVDIPSAAASVASKDNATSNMDVLTEKANTSPRSSDNLPLPSTTESTTTMVAPSSPVRSDVPMDSPSTRMGTDNKPTHRSPAQNQDHKSARDQPPYRQQRQFYPRNDNNRPNNQEGRPRADSYVNANYYNENRFNAGNRGYDRPPPQRDDRTFSNIRDTGYKPSYNGAPPVDDRRFVPREPSYPDDPPYAAKNYRPADWDMRRREGDRFADRPFDRERDREPRGPMMGPNETRNQKIPQQVGARSYPAERDGPRPFINRGPPDPFPMHTPANEPRGYDRDFYPPPPSSSAAPYGREISRVRPRSLSPRRDYRPGDRPPNKRPRGPDDSYGMSGPPPGKLLKLTFEDGTTYPSS
jgi:hypothetical protein